MHNTFLAELLQKVHCIYQTRAHTHTHTHTILLLHTYSIFLTPSEPPPVSSISFKCGERTYHLSSKKAQFKSPKSTSHIQVETINMRALAERKDSLDEEVKAAEAAAEAKDTQVSVTIDL